MRKSGRPDFRCDPAQGGNTVQMNRDGRDKPGHDGLLDYALLAPLARSTIRTTSDMMRFNSKSLGV